MENIFLMTMVATAFGVTVSYLIHSNLTKKRKKWKFVGELSEIIIYPMKAGCGVFLNEAYCSSLGLMDKKNDKKFTLGDRHFIAYDENTGLRISCKDHPIICKIKIVRIDDTFVLTAPGFEAFYLSLPDQLSNKVNCMIYHDIPSETIDCGDDVASWISKVLMKKAHGVRLGIYIKNKIKKRKDSAGMLKDYKRLYPDLNSKYLGAYSFLASYLLINQSSLEDLNDRLPSDEPPATSRRFRSNLTIKGMKPYEEDEWKWIRIGDNVILKNIKPCTRCVVVTLNPETAEFSKNNEPLSTLKKYRLMDDPEKNKVEYWSPVFGQYYGLHEGGNIRVGDPVYMINE